MNEHENINLQNCVLHMSKYVQTRVFLRMDVQTEIYILGHINHMYMYIFYNYNFNHVYAHTYIYI